MIVDTSALVAILQGEPEADVFVGRLTEARRKGERAAITAANLFELMLVIDGRKDDELSKSVDALFGALGLVVVPVDAELAAKARLANRSYGRRFHPAKLNFGDCFAYALAKQTGEPLLFKGEDFAQTDVVSAV
ncbi:type II toxin-antitoxin system VapC family toxin [Brevundimonas sp.]|uniref:type II toxin-antitoxin system VapC family toxin n=1 Tax=Brevundimonas sp. TaxID=1871086 RepID=UPI00286D2AD6|nr:type II toxin-antitoxin system VapC family toxin [Brevundimonas sp.]